MKLMFDLKLHEFDTVQETANFIKNNNEIIKQYWKAIYVLGIQDEDCDKYKQLPDGEINLEDFTKVIKEMSDGELVDCFKIGTFSSDFRFQTVKNPIFMFE